MEQTPTHPFFGEPMAVTAGYTGRWRITERRPDVIIVDGVVVATPITLEYNHPIIKIVNAVELPNGHVFCLEVNLMLSAQHGAPYIVLSAFHGDHHASYVKVTNGNINGMALMSGIASVARKAIPDKVQDAFGDGSYECLMALVRANRMVIRPSTGSS